MVILALCPPKTLGISPYLLSSPYPHFGNIFRPTLCALTYISILAPQPVIRSAYRTSKLFLGLGLQF